MRRGSTRHANTLPHSADPFVSSKCVSQFSGVQIEAVQIESVFPRRVMELALCRSRGSLSAMRKDSCAEPAPEVKSKSLDSFRGLRWDPV